MTRPHRSTTAPMAAVILAAALLLAGCANRAASPPPDASLYERLGGRAAIGAMVDEAIVRISTDPRINRRFANAGSGLTGNLVDLICVRSGGPCRYTGHDMAAAHDGMQIRDDEFDALLDDMALSLAAFKVPAREQAELLAALRQMRNAIVGH